METSMNCQLHYIQSQISKLEERTNARLCRLRYCLPLIKQENLHPNPNCCVFMKSIWLLVVTGKGLIISFVLFVVLSCQKVQIVQSLTLNLSNFYKIIPIIYIIHKIQMFTKCFLTTLLSNSIVTYLKILLN